MTWSQFLLWLVVAYLIYYFINIVIDLLFSTNNTKVEDDGFVELTHEENIVPVIIEPSEKKKEVGKIIPKNDIATTQTSERLIPDEEETSMMPSDPFAETVSSGALKISDLFNKHRPWSTQITDSIMFNK